MSELIKELAGQNRSVLEKQKRMKQAENDFGFFCRYYLSDYFYEEPAEYQKILYDVALQKTWRTHSSRSSERNMLTYSNQHKNYQEQCS